MPMVTALGFGVERERGGARILFKMNMARRNFRAGSPHLNQVRREDTIDSTALPSLRTVPYVGLARLSKTFFFL